LGLSFEVFLIHTEFIFLVVGMKVLKVAQVEVILFVKLRHKNIDELVPLRRVDRSHARLLFHPQYFISYFHQMAQVSELLKGLILAVKSRQISVN